MHVLRGRVVGTDRPHGGDRPHGPGQPALAVFGDGDRRPEDGHGHAGMVRLPLDRQPLPLGRPHREVEFGIRAQRCILGEGHRIRRPCAIHGGGRQQHDRRGADSGGGVEQRPRLFHPALELDHRGGALERGLQIVIVGVDLDHAVDVVGLRRAAPSRGARARRSSR